jgi:hypothetical protein
MLQPYTAAMAARKAQNPGFDYSQKADKDHLFAEGFGLSLSEFRLLKPEFDVLYLQLNPDKKSYKSNKMKIVKTQHINKFYDNFPSFCDVPEDWKHQALTRILTDTRTRIQRQSEPDQPTTSQAKPNPGKRSRSTPSDYMDILPSTETSREAKRLRSESIVPILDAPTVSVSRDTTVHFIDSDNEIIAEYLLTDLMDSDNLIVLWEKLVGEAKACHDPMAFPFNNTLFLSPRPKQQIPIRSQIQLVHALRDFSSDLAVQTDVVARFTVAKPAPYAPSASIDVNQEHGLDTTQQSNNNKKIAERLEDGGATANGREDDPLPPLSPTPKGENDNNESQLAPIQSQTANNETQVANIQPQLVPIQPQAANIQPQAANIQPQAANIQPQAANIQPQAANSEPEHATIGSQLATNRPQSGKDNADSLMDGPRTPTEQMELSSEEEHQEEAEVEHQEEAEAEHQEEGEVEDGKMDDDDEDDDDEPDAAAAAMAYAATQSNTLTANKAAQRDDLPTWERAAQLYRLNIEDMRLRDNEMFVELPTDVGFSPSYRSMPHQLVGSSETHAMAFGPKGRGILADEMGLGKTDTILQVHHTNHYACAKQDGVLPAAAFPTIDADGMINGAAIRPAAVWISASSQGLEAWPKAWKRMYENGPWKETLPQEWWPTLVLLHADGKVMCERYGGEEVGLRYSLTDNEWAEVRALPDWDHAREAAGYPSLQDAVKVTWGLEVPKSTHPRATKLGPSPTSSRFVIVSTNQSWRSHVNCTWSDDHNKYRKAQAALNKLIKANPRYTAMIRTAKNDILKIKSNWYSDNARYVDGYGCLQTSRWVDVTFAQPGAKRNDVVRVLMVCDPLFAAMVVIDELHAAANPTTLTYSQIIKPAIAAADALGLTRPGIVGMTGSALANGMPTTLHFIHETRGKTCARESLETLSAQFLRETWAKVEQIFRSALKIKSKVNIAQTLAAHDDVRRLFEAFAHTIYTFFIARDYTSKDPWGRTLHLVDASLVIRNVVLAHEPHYHAQVQEIEGSIQASVKDKYRERLEQWNEGGRMGPIPDKPAMSKADPAVYGLARNMAVFPNLVHAIESYQEAHPEEELIIGEQCTWGYSIGKENVRVQMALRSWDTIRESFLWKIAKEASEGSEKMEFILKSIQRLSQQKSTHAHPDPDLELDDSVWKYRSKYVLVTNLRFARAIVACRIAQVWGLSSMVVVSGGKDRTNLVPEWKKTFAYNKKEQAFEIADRCFIMVAGLKVVCQSIDLTEGHVLDILEPHPNNAEGVQVQKRQHRVGQKHPTVYVRWLIHDGSIIDTKISQRNVIKTTFANGVQSTNVDGTLIGREIEELV